MNTNVSQLEGASQILHLIHHRNKNQHRHTHWWKWLAMLKRSIAKLIVEISHGQFEHASARMKYMDGLLLPRCYSIFTQIINDNQFSALGLTLVAELARIRRIIGLENGETGEPDKANVSKASESHKDLRAPFEDLGQAVAKPGTSVSTVENGPYSPSAGGLPDHSDPHSGGGSLERPETDVVVAAAILKLREDSREVSAAKRKKAPTDPAKRQKRKPTNIIDDLFQGLE